MINTLWLHSNVTQTHPNRAIAKRHLGSHQKAEHVANIGEEVHEELQRFAAAMKKQYTSQRWENLVWKLVCKWCG